MRPHEPVAETIEHGETEPLLPARQVGRHVLSLCRPHLRTFIWIALLAALSSVAEVAAPLVYRTAVNDLTGLFVHQAQGHFKSPEQLSAATREQHTRSHVAPRHPNQVVVSLLKAVLLLFLLKTAAQFFFYAADGVSARVSDGIEKGLILSTFGALLRRPLAFFALRPSGALVKQVAQIDSVAPIVSALSRDLLPETFRVVATVSVMLTVHPRLTAIALATIPAYAWVSWRMARRLEAGLDRSVGERQRLLLACALLARPRLLVLDEATANLDFATEVEVKRALARARGNRTMLVIAHRFSMVEDADHVIVLDRGQVVEQGTVEELRSAGGWFSRFAHSAAGADGR